MAYLSGGSLNTTQPDITDNFYAKSLMTPQCSPMSMGAINAFISYLANEVQNSTMVSFNWLIEKNS